MIEIIDRTKPPAALPWRPFALGFRPFFLVAGLSAVLLLGLWLFIWQGVITAPAYYGPINWHAHEMLFGYTAAVIAGFLLTAVRNWSGMATATHGSLAALVALWLAGRIIPFIPDVPERLIAVVDISFLPILALSLLKPLWKSGNRANLAILVILLIMSLANGMMHIDHLGATSGWSATGIQLMVNVILFLILMIAGRVMPFFTEAALPGTKCLSRRWIEFASIGSLILLIVVDLVGLKEAAAIVAVLVAIIQATRLSGWFHSGAFRIPVLLVLYGGYAWLIAGLLLKSLAGFNLVSSSAAVHAFTVGTLGLFTLGRMARVSLGHTGRAMRTVRATNLAFLLVGLAALSRSVMPILLPTYYSAWIQLAGSLWIVGFGIFVWIYAPILLRGRVDGKPG